MDDIQLENRASEPQSVSYGPHLIQFVLDTLIFLKHLCVQLLMEKTFS